MGVIEILKQHIKDQFVDYSAAPPIFNYSEGLNKFFIASALGILEYSPKNSVEASRFRNKYINRFSEICEKHKRGEKIIRDLFKFYKDARTHRGVKYRANWRTRLRNKIGVC